jgi:DNA gyrase subunit B
VVTVQPDEEHNLHSLVVEDRSNGYPRYSRIDLDFVQTGEYRTLLNGYADIRGVEAPVVVAATAPTPTEVDETDPGLPMASTDDTRIGGGEVDEATKLAAEPPAAREAGAKPSKEPERVALDSLDALVEFFITAGKKGVAINRYKGLGEMNPEQLWSTTMKPEVRTLLQVRAEDHTEADLMFTTLMGDQVEPRRKFIEDNALDVKNLDI